MNAVLFKHIGSAWAPQSPYPGTFSVFMNEPEICDISFFFLGIYDCVIEVFPNGTWQVCESLFLKYLF